MDVQEGFNRRRFLQLVLRLSLVVAITAAVYDQFTIYTTAVDQQREYREAERVYSCAVRLSKEVLEKYRSGLGNYDVGRACSSTFRRDGSFIVSGDELDQFRQGRPITEIFKPREWYDLNRFLWVLLLTALITNLVGIVALGCYLLVKWVIYGAQR